MGLDITAYERAALAPPHEHNDDCYEQGHVWVSQTFIDSFPLSSEGLLEGCYLTDGDTLDFRAGSYSGYNAWRETLCERENGVSPAEVWKEPVVWKDAAFFELINFSDCEGTIGPLACARLAQDFKEARYRIPSGDEWFDRLYETWAEAFELAANTGLVDFR